MKIDQQLESLVKKHPKLLEDISRQSIRCGDCLAQLFSKVKLGKVTEIKNGISVRRDRCENKCYTH